jgi:hypothetical protein
VTGWETPRRWPRLQLVAIEGRPNDSERAAIAHALERIVAAELQARAPSMWLRAGRARGRRLGMYDYRDRLHAGEAWSLSLRFPSGGREYQGRAGRGDAR